MFQTLERGGLQIVLTISYMYPFRLLAPFFGGFLFGVVEAIIARLRVILARQMNIGFGFDQIFYSEVDYM